MEQKEYTRREFLIRSAKAGACVAGVSGLSFWLHDEMGPQPTAGGDPLVTLPDFSVSGMDHKISIVRGEDRVKTVNQALKALGGIEAFIRLGDRVLLKVNAAFATPPILSATTNPQLTAEVVRLCYAAGASSVVVTDNPINDPASCFSLTGIAEAARSQGAKVLLPRARLFQPTTVPNGTLIRNWPILWEPFLGTNKVIGIAPV